MQRSLPLLDENHARSRRRALPPAERHLSAARRLARDIRRTAPGSEEQTRTGRRICRHLIAMLEQRDGARAGDGVHTHSP
jgi:hypothetical protein